MRRAALVGAALVLVLGALFVVRPFLAAQRDYAASVPSPAALRQTSVVPLPPDRPTCFSNAAIERHSEEARFNVSSPDGPAPPIGVSIDGGPYHYEAVVPAGTLDTQQVRLPIPAAPGNYEVRVCFRNQGEQPVGLFASDDRTRSRSAKKVRGERVERSIWFSFHENFPHTIVERLPATAERMTVFRPGYVTEALVWVLALLFVVGVPVAVVWAYLRALREDEPDGRVDPDVRRARPWWRRVFG